MRYSRNNGSAIMDGSRKARPSEEQGSIRPFSPDAHIGTTLSGAVIYEPNSLLTGLSGVGRTQPVTQDMPEVTLVPKSSERQKGFLLIIDEPITHTFEIII